MNISLKIFIVSVVVFSAGLITVNLWPVQEKILTSQGVLPRAKNIGIREFLESKKKLPLKNEEVSLIAVGDISYSRTVERMVKKNNDINYPLLRMNDYLVNADLTFGNLETPITSGREIQTGEIVFRSNPGTERALSRAGFDILSLANNHTPNYGEIGLKDTFKYLDEVGIKYVGAGLAAEAAEEPVIMEVKGLKFAFLAYNSPDVVPPLYQASDKRAGTAFMDIKKMVKAVKEVKLKVDFVIVSMHAGTEYVVKPNATQVNFARAAIDAGADLVIGHHPHVVQTMEKYQGKYIFYSLGNFIFDQPWSEDTKKGLAAKIYFTKQGVSRISLLPVYMENIAQPAPTEGAVGDGILKRLDYALADRGAYTWESEKNNYVESKSKVIYNSPVNQAGQIERVESADLNKNSVPEIYTLAAGRLTVKENAKQIFATPADWWVDNFILADSTNDGVVDLNLSVWKAGNFGSSKPFWVKTNDMSIKNHFFIFNFKAGRIAPVWQSSNLEKPNLEIAIADANGDQKNDLIVIEGDYVNETNCRDNYLAVWSWNGWGFSNDWRSSQGNYCDLEIEKINGKNYISAVSN